MALAGLAALAVAMGIGRFAFTPVLPMMLHDAGLSVVQGGWLASANYLGYLAGALWAGAVRARGDVAIRGGLAVIGFTTLGMALDAGLEGWAMLRAVAGVASAWGLIRTSAWAFEHIAPAGKPALAGIVFAGVGVGIIAAGGLCVLLMAYHAASSTAWLVLGIVSLATAAIAWPVFGSSSAAANAGREPRRSTGGELRLVLAYGAYGLGYIIPATFLPVMAKEVASDPAVFGWAWPAFGAAAALSTLSVALLSGRAEIAPPGSAANW